MESGLSKEQIDELYKTSRKYFDELAKYYYEKDRDYYNKYFAPYYSKYRTIPNLKARLVLMLILTIVALIIFGITYLFKESTKKDGIKLPEENSRIEKNAKAIQDSARFNDSIYNRLKKPLIDRTGKDKARKSREEIK